MENVNFDLNSEIRKDLNLLIKSSTWNFKNANESFDILSELLNFFFFKHPKYILNQKIILFYNRFKLESLKKDINENLQNDQKTETFDFKISQIEEDISKLLTRMIENLSEINLIRSLKHLIKSMITKFIEINGNLEFFKKLKQRFSKKLSEQLDKYFKKMVWLSRKKRRTSLKFLR